MKTESGTVNLVIAGLIVLGLAVVAAATLLTLNDKNVSDAMWSALGGAVTGLGAILARTSPNDASTPVHITNAPAEPVPVEETPSKPRRRT